jgi:hypothetical protein
VINRFKFPLKRNFFITREHDATRGMIIPVVLVLRISDSHALPFEKEFHSDLYTKCEIEVNIL